jgi:hypothetical protein
VGHIFHFPDVRLPAAKKNASTGSTLPADVKMPTLQLLARQPGQVAGEVRISAGVPDASTRAQSLSFRISER